MKIIDIAVKKVYRFNCPNCQSRLEADSKEVVDIGGKVCKFHCDWWAFSWQKGKLDEIFGWYDEHCKYMKLHPKTRKTIEDILEKMKTKLDEIKEKK